MILIAIWLIAVGTSDLVRANVDTTNKRRQLGVCTVGVVLVIALSLSVHPDRSDWVIVMVGAVTLVGWVLSSAHTLNTSSVTGRVVAFASLSLGLVVAVLGEGSSAGVEWPSVIGGSPLSRLDAADAMLVLGVLLVQIATANIVVRVLLDAVGVPPAKNEKKLKGGRVLGPMERVFIVTLGLGGATTAAAILVAAKGILRFPELGKDEPGPSELTEYFLIGSLSSWLLALGGIALVSLAHV